MKKFMAWVKKHPLTVILIIVVGVLFLLFLNSSGGSQTVVAAGAAGPTDAQVGAQAAVTTAQLQASTQIHGIDASVIAAQNQQAFQIAEDTINSQVAMYQTQLGASVQFAGIAAQENIQLAGIQAGVQTADLANRAALEQAGVFRDIITSRDRVVETQYNDAALVAINGQNVGGAVAMAPYSTLNTLAQTGAIDKLVSIKDAFLNLGSGISIGRGTNFTPPGATPGQPNAIAQFLGAATSVAAMAFG